MTTILHVIDSTEPGGAETVFAQLADELRKDGYRSITVVSGEGWVTDELRRRGLEPILMNSKGAFNFNLLKGLTSLIRQEKVDLIQSHLLGSNVYSSLAGFGTRRPVVATFHGMVDVSPNERMRWMKAQAMNLGVTRFVAVSAKLRDEIHAQGLLNPRKTTVIYNGIDQTLYGRKLSSELRTRLQLSADARIVGSLGNLHPAKGYADLISAAHLVVAKYPSAHFVIGGAIKDDVHKPLMEQVAAAGLASHIHFIGFVTDVPAFLAQLDMFLLTSISEGFSIATLEAMATGLPIVATRCGGPEEILEDGVDALLVEVGNAEVIAAAVSTLLGSTARAEALSAAGQAKVQAKFGMTAMLESYKSLYTTILRSH